MSDNVFNKIKDLMPREGKRYKILDAGTGGGVWIDFLIQHGKVSACDVFRYKINELRKKHRNVDFKVANLNIYLPYKDEEFDIVVLAEVLEHLYNPEVCLYEINRVLKKDGILIMSTPNSANIKERIMHVVGKTSSETQAKNIVNRHLFFFSHSYLKNMLHNSGFRIEKDVGYFKLPIGNRVFNAIILKSLFSDNFFLRCKKIKNIKPDANIGKFIKEYKAS